VDNVTVESIREARPLWLVMRFERDEDGRDDDCKQVGAFWDEGSAWAERDRRNAETDDPGVRYEVGEAEARVVYWADEPPPWSTS
jgi:hypothetical protein